MELFNTAGVTKTGEIVVSQAFESLLININISVSALTTETIYIEKRRKGTPERITKQSMPLADFICATTYGQLAIPSTSKYPTSVLCRLTNGGNLFLGTDEELVISLDGLVIDNTYSLYSLETPVNASHRVDFESKIIRSDVRSDKLPVADFDLIIMQRNADVTKYYVKFDSGAQITLLPEELDGMLCNVDSIFQIEKDGAVTTQPNTIVWPVVGVQSIEIDKKVGSSINVYLRAYKQL